MRAFILAAGIGSRLRPITDNVPKCMVEVCGEKIIDRQITALINAGIKEIFVVGGYKFDVLKKHLRLKFPHVTLIENADYLKNNNMYSVFLTKKFAIGHDCIYMNADVFVDSSYIKILVDSNYENTILAQKDRYEDENMKICFNGKKIYSISKQIDKYSSFATSIDMYKFSKSFILKWFDIISNYIIDKKIINLWNEVSINDMFEFFDVFPTLIDNKWFEIDTLDDLNKAEELFKN